MARNKKEMTGRDERPSSSGNAAAAQRNEKRPNRTSSPSSNKRNGGRRFRGRSPKANQTLEAMSITTPLATDFRVSTLVYPSDSASMQGFGTRTTTPGQDNFITTINQIQVPIRADEAPDTPPLRPNAASRAKRTSNAMVFNIVPLFGATHATGDTPYFNPMNLAAMNLKQFIDTSFGTVRDYTAHDLLLYLAGVYAVFPTIAVIKRALRLALSYTENQYPAFIPKGLFAALKIGDGEHNYLHGEGALYTAQHLREWIDELNQILLSFNRLPMPPEIVAFGYNDDLLEKMYLDSDDVNTAQLYLFNVQGNWMYNEELADDGAFLYWFPYDIVGLNVQNMLDRLNWQVSRLSALHTSSTAMMQNLFNAFGSRDTVQVPLLSYDDLTPVERVFDENILTMVENLVLCPEDQVTIPAFKIDENSQTVQFHVYTNATAMLPNLPLQFHKSFEEINGQDIGWALRLHPAFQNKRSFHEWHYDGHTAGDSTVSAYTADGFTGFAIARSQEIFRFNDQGEVSGETVPSRAIWATNTAASVVARFAPDFHAAPIQVLMHETDSEYVIEWYSARRDVEVSYRLDDLAMHWTYLTQTVWAANVNRNVQGTRKLG